MIYVFVCFCIVHCICIVYCICIVLYTIPIFICIKNQFASVYLTEFPPEGRKSNQGSKYRAPLWTLQSVLTLWTVSHESFHSWTISIVLEQYQLYNHYRWRCHQKYCIRFLTFVEGSRNSQWYVSNWKSVVSESLSHKQVKCVTILHTLEHLLCFLSGLFTRTIKDFLCSGLDYFKDFSWILPGLPQSHGFLSPGHQIGHL